MKVRIRFEQVVPVEHTGDEALLVVRAAAPCSRSSTVRGIRVGPTVEVLLAVRSDRAELRLLAAGRHDELVVVEQRRTALALGPALLAVTEQLVDRLGDGVLDLRRLALDDDHRQAVQEQHDVRVDVVLGAEYPDLELADSDESVVVPLREIDEPNRRALLARLAVLADAGVLKQQLE